MTYYQQQVCLLTEQVYPKAYITDRIVCSKHFIDRHFSRDICLDEVAREASLSKFHFIRLFKKYYGRTPHQYLVSVRITKAKELLQRDFSVSATCYAVGFSSLSTFTGFFKQAGGSTPLLYRKKATLKK